GQTRERDRPSSACSGCRPGLTTGRGDHSPASSRRQVGRRPGHGLGGPTPQPSHNLGDHVRPLIHDLGGRTAPRRHHSDRRTMKLTALVTIPYTIPYTHPLRFASGEVHAADLILSRMQTDGGIVGIADAPPRPYTYGETQQSIQTIVQDVFAPQIIGMDPFDRE